MLDPVVRTNYELEWEGGIYDGQLNAYVAAHLIIGDNVAELDARIHNALHG